MAFPCVNDAELYSVNLNETKKTMKDVNLGSEVQDTISTYSGIVVCISEWLNGCKRITLQAKGLLEGKPIEQQTFDIEQLELVAAAPAKHTPNVHGASAGGPHDPPTRNAVHA